MMRVLDRACVWHREAAIPFKSSPLSSAESTCSTPVTPSTSPRGTPPSTPSSCSAATWTTPIRKVNNKLTIEKENCRRSSSWTCRTRDTRRTSIPYHPTVAATRAWITPGIFERTRRLFDAKDSMDSSAVSYLSCSDWQNIAIAGTTQTMASSHVCDVTNSNILISTEWGIMNERMKTTCH